MTLRSCREESTPTPLLTQRPPALMQRVQVDSTYCSCFLSPFVIFLAFFMSKRKAHKKGRSTWNMGWD